MSTYIVTVYTDMDNLLVSNYKIIPSEILDFIYQKAKDCLYCAYDKEGRGCLFHILKDGMEDRWIYEYKGNSILVTYDVYHFNQQNMIAYRDDVAIRSAPSFPIESGSAPSV